MSRYLRMVMLVLAGLCFMIPMLGKTSVARPMPRGLHGGVQHHQQFQTNGPNDGSDDPAVPCAP